MRRCCQLPAVTHKAIVANAASVGIHAGRRCRAAPAERCASPAQRPATLDAGARARDARRSAFPMRAIVIVALIAVVTALFTALVFLYRDRGRGTRVVTALAIRVLLSMALIAFLVFSWWMGWIQPGRL
jgi:hypothetical protein